MSTTIGEVSINLRLSMAKFQSDIQQSTSAVKQASDQVGEAAGSGTDKARESLRLLSEEVGIRLPRGIQTFIAGLPGVGTALNAAFTGVAIVALIGLVSEIIAKIEEFKQHAADVQAAFADIGTSGADSLRKLQEQSLALTKQFDELIGDKLGAFRAALQQIDDVRLDSLKDQLASISKEVDGFLAKMQTSSTFNILNILWGGTDPNAGISQVRDFFTQIQTNLAQFDKSGNLSAYGATLAEGLKQAQGAATGLSEQGPVVRQAWAGVAEYFGQLEAQFKQTNANADQQKLNTTIAETKKQTDELADSVAKVGTAWLDMQAHVTPASTDPTAEIEKHLNDAITAIQHFGIVADGVWNTVDIAAAKASATDRAYANELTQLIALTNSFSAANRNIVNPTLNVPQLQATVVENMTSLQKEVQAIQQGGQDADDVTQRIIDAQETLKQKVKETQQELVILFSQGRINAEQYIKGLQQADAELQTHQKDWTKLGTTIGQALNEFATGTATWRKSLEDVAIQIAELILKMTVLKGLQGDSSFFGQLASGLVGAIGGRAEGGPVDANTPYWVGERRTPELFVPSVPGHIVPMAQLHSGGTSNQTNIHMEINTPDANSFGMSQGQLLADAYRNARVAAAQNRGR